MSTPSMQTPPFLQGEDAHSSKSRKSHKVTKCSLIHKQLYYSLVSHTSPVYPLMQLHVKALILSIHVPPFWHGSDEHSPISRNYLKRTLKPKESYSFRSCRQYARECTRRYTRQCHQYRSLHFDKDKTHTR